MKRIFVICILISAQLALGIQVFAKQDPPIVQLLIGSNGQVNKDSSATVSDGVYNASPSSLPFNAGSCRYQNIITLKINEQGNTFIQGDFTVSVPVSLALTDFGGAQSTQQITLAVSYKKGAGLTYNAVDYRVLSGFRVVKATISDTISRNVAWDVASLLVLENEMRISRDYNFDCSIPVPGLSGAFPSIGGVDQTDELLVGWNDPNDGQTEYDLEWAWVDNSALANFTNTSGGYDAASIFSNNASRVTLAADHLSYKIPLMYDGTGILFYRIRPVQTKLSGIRVEGTWTALAPSSQFAFGGHQSNLNWQVTTSYAEEGKRKTVVQYFDGSLRGRQTVTKDNSIEVPTTVVAETMYDYQGRAAIQVLPAPTLNTIIQFTKNFNQGINGQDNSPVEYTKGQYDGLLPSDLLCTKAAGQMHPASGASQYYSPNNPLAGTGINKYIPDASKYPFTETRYTPDATGRIATQGGVGPTHILGSQHETKYYYGQAGQEDLDPLFGTDVGYASHYFKNMVRDANGQYSVSYVDMHGRTVATALAGNAPADVQQLPNFSVRNNITKKLLDKETNIVKDRSVESVKEIMVPVAGPYEFKYNLSPTSLQLLDKDNNTVCYSCMYDLSINISNDCGNCGMPNRQPIVITRSNFSLDKLDSICANSTGSLLVDTTINFAEGSYTVRKTLTLSRGAQDGYRTGLYTRRNTVQTFASIYNETLATMQGQQSNCTVTCESCNAAIGTAATYETNFLAAAHIDPTNEDADTKAAIAAAYQQALASCAAICNKGTPPLDGIRSAMLLDMTPDVGQYANPDSSTKPYNIFNSGDWQSPRDPSTGSAGYYLDQSGISVSPDPRILSQDDFVNGFQSSWANSLLFYHPEYPRLHLAETTLAPSEAFDNSIQNAATISDAQSLIPSLDIVAADPFFAVDLSDASVMQGKVTGSYQSHSGTSVSMWQVAYASVFCADNTTAQSCITSAPSGPPDLSNITCGNDWDRVWAAFRQMYLFEKKKLTYNWSTSQINGGTGVTVSDLVASHYIPRFIDPNNLAFYPGGASSAFVNDPNNINTLKSSMADSASGFYSDNCNANAATWLQQLQPLKTCNPSLTDDDLSGLVKQLVQICIKGSDASHPFGSASVSPSNSSYQPGSFPGAIANFMASKGMVNTATCNPYMLDGMQAYAAAPSVYAGTQVFTRPDSCTCSRIAQLQAEANARAYGGSLSGFLKAFYNTDISQGALDSLQGMCQGSLVPACTYLPNSINLPPVLQCSAAQPESSCLTCPVMQGYLGTFISVMGQGPVAAPLTAGDTALNIAFEKFMAYQTGFNYTYDRYMSFLQQCSSYTAVADTSKIVLPPNVDNPLELFFTTGSQIAGVYSQYGAQVYDNGFSTDGSGTVLSGFYGALWRTQWWSPPGSGPLNRCSIWPNSDYDPTDGYAPRPPYGTCVTVSRQVNFTHAGTYYFGLGADDNLKLTIDGISIIETTADFTNNWRIYPVTLSQGVHMVSLTVVNNGGAGAIGCEIYDCTLAQLQATSGSYDYGDISPYIIYTTASETGSSVVYSCTAPAPPMTGALPICYDHTSSQVGAFTDQGTTVYQPGFNPDGTGSVAATMYTGGVWKNNGWQYTDGPLNRTSVWLCSQVHQASNSCINFSRQVYFPTSGTYYVGISCASGYCGFGIDNISIVNNTPQGPIDAYRHWFVYPISIAQAGMHTLTIFGLNSAGDNNVGCEVYNNTLAQLQAASQMSDLNILYTTATETGNGYPDCTTLPMGPTPINCTQLLAARNLYESHFSRTDTLYQVDMVTLAGNVTPQDGPKGVFDINGNLIGNTVDGTIAQVKTSFVNIWNSSVADTTVGKLSLLGNGKFGLKLKPGQIFPCKGVVGMRYWQFDAQDTLLDGIIENTGTYTDFGDGTRSLLTTGVVYSTNLLGMDYQLIQTPSDLVTHHYTANIPHTVTVYHSDTLGRVHIDNGGPSALNIAHFKNLRGYFPQQTLVICFHSTEDATMNTFANVRNFGTFTGLQYFVYGSGDNGQTPFLNNSLVFDRRQTGLRKVVLDQFYSVYGNHPSGWQPIPATFPGWDTVYTQLDNINITGFSNNITPDTHFRFPKLKTFSLVINEYGTPASEIDRIINEIASSTTQDSGLINVAYGGGTLHTSASAAALLALKNRGWAVVGDVINDGTNSDLTAYLGHARNSEVVEDYPPYATPFTMFVNALYGTGYSKRQLDSAFAVCGDSTLDICTAPTAIYTGPTLCGDGQPVYAAITVPKDTTCNDVYNLAVNKATDRYNFYTDSIENVFDTAYYNKCMQAAQLENFTVTSQVAEYHYTLYYYDQAGSLVKTVPPAGVQANYDAAWLQSVADARGNGTVVQPSHTLVTEYRYNTLGQVVAQQTPDAGLGSFWYDRLGRLAVSRNAKQATNNRYSYTLYDQLGRITEVGQQPQATDANSIDTKDPEALAAWLTVNSSVREQVTRTVYDLPYPYLCTPNSSLSTLCQANLRNRVSYVQLWDNADDGAPKASTYYSYDVHGNVDTLLQDINQGAMLATNNRFKKIVYTYDLISGKVNTVSYQSGAKDQFFHRYNYDAENRLTNAETSADAVYWELDAQYNYYKHGPLARSILGQLQVQGMDHAYTLQGWLKGTNSTDISGDDPNSPYITGDMGADGGTGSIVARDALGFGLGYYYGDYLPISGASNNPFNTGPPVPLTANDGNVGGKELFNGNISLMALNLPKVGVPVLNAYGYDQLNRLVAMDQYTGLNQASNTWVPVSTDKYRERITYDPNGNILTYKRNGNAARLYMDDMTYTYKANTNKLDKVADVAPDAAAGVYDQYNDIKQGQGNGNYGYDPIGNLTSDVSEGINNINWSVYGKIQSISKDNGTNIAYTYDPSGNRISKTVNGKETDYVRDATGNVMAVYYLDPAANSGNLVQTEMDLYGSSRLGVWYSNRVMDGQTANAAQGSLTRGSKSYELTNHLGNVLATVSDRNLQHSSDNATVDYYTADILNATDYAPFGMALAGRSFNAGTLYRYGFNGKENDKDINDGAQDYGIRISDVRLGRFLSVDPLIMSYPMLTPYQYASNTPIQAIDLDGLEKLVIHEVYDNYGRMSQSLISGIRSQDTKEAVNMNLKSAHKVNITTQDVYLIRHRNSIRNNTIIFEGPAGSLTRAQNNQIKSAPTTDGEEDKNQPENTISRAEQTRRGNFVQSDNATQDKNEFFDKTTRNSLPNPILGSNSLKNADWVGSGAITSGGSVAGNKSILSPNTEKGISDDINNFVASFKSSKKVNVVLVDAITITINNNNNRSEWEAVKSNLAKTYNTNVSIIVDPNIQLRETGASQYDSTPSGTYGSIFYRVSGAVGNKSLAKKGAQ